MTDLSSSDFRRIGKAPSSRRNMLGACIWNLYGAEVLSKRRERVCDRDQKYMIEDSQNYVTQVNRHIPYSLSAFTGIFFTTSQEGDDTPCIVYANDDYFIRF